MPSQPATAIAVRMKYVQGSANYENVYHLSYEVPPTPAVLDLIATAFEAWETSQGALLRADDVSLVEIHLADLASLDASALTYPVNPPIPGTRDSPPLPANATYAVKADIGKRGRGRNGRVFWIGMTEDQANGNEIAALAKASLLDALEDLRSGVEALGGFRLSVLSRYENGVLRAEGITHEIIGFSATDDTMDSQRNRLPNHRKRSSANP